MAESKLYRVYLLLGSNLPYREKSSLQLMEQANSLLIDRLLPDYLEIGDLNNAVRTSEIIQTKPYGTFSDKTVNDFCNQAFMCLTDKAPYEVLQVCLEIEQQLGRQRPNIQDRFYEPAVEQDYRDEDENRVYQSRTMDIDILKIFDGENEILLNDVNLQLPHPMLKQRKFAQRLLKQILK